jgi:hypothetical protein
MIDSEKARRTDPERLKAAISDLRTRLEEDGWGTYPRDRSTLPYEDAIGASLQTYAKQKYGQADRSLKQVLKAYFDDWDQNREFTAFDEELAGDGEVSRPLSHSVEPSQRYTAL